MATPSKVQLTTNERPTFWVQDAVTKDAAQKASELLQENHDKHHIFFNEYGFHNHIAHHLLTIYALGADPKTFQKQYDRNKGYQRPPVSIEDSVVKDMGDPSHFSNYLGNEKYYHDFLLFFQDEMEKKGWRSVLQEYLFKGDERANDMFVRLYAGFLHPIIHLGFGVEFEQPAIMAEALAQTAVHDNWIGKLLLPAEEAAKKHGNPDKAIVELLDEIRADEKLSNSPHWDDGNKVRDGILKRAPEEMMKYAGQYVVRPNQLEEKHAEMINAIVYYTGGAQRPTKQVRYDFYFIHCLNCSIFFSAFLKQPWLSTENKIRMLEWKVRTDLVMYPSRRSPKIRLDEIQNYQAKKPEDGWNAIFERVKQFEDDGHGSKLVRALAHGQEVCKPYEDRDTFRIKYDMWLKLGHMAIDSVENGDPVWVRSAGFDEAWENVPDSAKL